MRIRRMIYDYADYIARKHYHVHIHELPDEKRREVLKFAAEDLAEAYESEVK